MPDFSRQKFWFGEVSSRPLSWFRIAFALVLLKDALFHLPIATLFYSDDGVVTRAAMDAMGGYNRFSLLNVLPQAWMVQLFFLVWLAVVLCLLVGFRTRPMTILNFVITLSIFERNPFLESGADVILRLLSFWIMFIPLHYYYSLDSLLARRKNPAYVPPSRAYAFPVRMIQIQIAIVYFAAGTTKLLGNLWWNGTAVYYVLQLDSMLLPPGKWLAANSPDWLIHVLTYSVVLIEVSFPILVFIPLGQPFLRRLALILVGLLHLGIAITMTIPLVDFLLVLGSSYLVFLAQDVPTTLSRPTVHASQRRKLIFLTVVPGIVMALVLWKNADNFRRQQAQIAPIFPNQAVNLLNILGLDQGWELFAPNPIRMDWSVAVVGVLPDGQRFNLRTGQPFEEKVIPDDALATYRWKRFEHILGTEQPIPVWASVSAYYCRAHNAIPAPPQMVQLRFVYHLAHAPGEPPYPVSNELLWMRICES